MLGSVADLGGGEVEDDADGIYGDGESLDFGRVPLAHFGDDGGEEDAEAIEHSVAAELGDGPCVDFPILDSCHDVLLMQLLAGRSDSNFVIAHEATKATFVFSEEACGFDAVGEHEWHEEGRQDSWNAVDEDDPTPGAPSRCSRSVVVHEADSVCNQATDGTGCCRCRVEVGGTEGDLSLIVK